MTEPKWRIIPAFPNYSVSNTGHIRHDRIDRLMHPSKNQQGHLKVNLMKDGEAHTRHVNLIVANAFLDNPRRRDFISVIHLDGDKTHCDVTNLMWRPRYFSIKYHMQFDSPHFTKTKLSVQNMKTGEEFKTIQEAVMQYGLLLNDILASIHTRTYVWPTYHEFRAL